MRIKNWKKFQHFKDRTPPWIKLHREVLEQRDINLISDCSFRVLIGLWLLASEDEHMNGGLPDIDDISFRLRMDKKKIVKSLQELTNWVILDDIKTISEGYQVDDAEKRREETEGEKKNLDQYEEASLKMKDTIIKLFPLIGSLYAFEFEKWREYRQGKKPVLDLSLNLMDWMKRAAGKINDKPQQTLEEF